MSMHNAACDGVGHMYCGGGGGALFIVTLAQSES